jgi:hypothetical protein
MRGPVSVKRPTQQPHTIVDLAAGCLRWIVVPDDGHQGGRRNHLTSTEQQARQDSSLSLATERKPSISCSNLQRPK